MGDKEIGVSRKRSIFFTCIFDSTDKHAPDHEIHLAARTAFYIAFARVSMEILLHLLRQNIAYILRSISNFITCVLVVLHYNLRARWRP